jgi:hypothetical protein
MNIYNPNKPMTYNEISFYVNQLTPTYIIVGDFNAHHNLLFSSCMHPDTTGRSIEELLINTSAILMNNIDFYTYIDSRSGAWGCLDLVLVSADIAPLFELKLLHYVGSDHFPLCALASLPLIFMQTAPVPCWKIENRSLSSFARTVPTSKLKCPASVEELS